MELERDIRQILAEKCGGEIDAATTGIIALITAARRPALPDREAVELILRDTLTVGHGSTDGFAVTFVDGIQEAVEYICALSPAQAERDDMVLVPREPTEAMLNASWLTTAAATPDERMAMELCDSKAAFKLKLARRYRAMLSAAPKEEPDHG